MAQPKYKEIADTIQKQIGSGERIPGELLPTEKALMAEFGVSRVTIRKSLALLEEQGLLNRIRGKGTYISGDKLQHNAFHLKSFIEDVAAQGKQPGSKVIQFELLSASERLASKLNINAGDEVYALARLRLIDGEPEVLEKAWMPVDLFPDLSLEILKHSKYQYIELQKGLKIALSREKVVAEVADDFLAETLNVAVGQPLIKVVSVGELVNGRAFEFSENYFSLKQFSFEFTALRRQD